MPGTWASLATLALAAAIGWGCGTDGIAVAAAVLFAAGWWASSRVSAASGVADPGYVVIDEITAQLLALMIAPLDWRWYGAAFALFRLFDIWKPFPVNWADRHVSGGLGIMLDDILAALYVLVLIAIGEGALGVRP